VTPIVLDDPRQNLVAVAADDLAAGAVRPAGRWSTCSSAAAGSAGDGPDDGVVAAFALSIPSTLAYPLSRGLYATPARRQARLVRRPGAYGNVQLVGRSASSPSPVYRRHGVKTFLRSSWSAGCGPGQAGGLTAGTTEMNKPSRSG
jgi:hypothetical protein